MLWDWGRAGNDGVACSSSSEASGVYCGLGGSAMAGWEVEGDEICLWFMIPAMAAAGLCTGLCDGSDCPPLDSRLSFLRDSAAGAVRVVVVEVSSDNSI